MCRSKGMAIRGHISGRGPRSGKDERQRTFRAVHVTGAAITSMSLIPPSKAGPLFYEVMGDHGSPAGTSVRLLKYTGSAIPNYNLLRNSATVMAVAMAAFKDSEPLSFLGYGGM